MDLAVVGKRKKRAIIGNVNLMLFTFATVFFPRLFSYFGAPSLINFGHLLVVPIAVGVVLATTRVKNRKQIAIVWELIFAMGIFLSTMVASALINDAGEINVFLQFMLQAQPYVFLLALVSISFSGKSLTRFRRWVLGFGLFNLILALVQSVLLPIGLYPRRGGTIADNTAGVFASSTGSAGNYVSCTISVYFALYLMRFKSIPLWIRIAALLASLYQVYISDSKQIFLAFLLGWILLIISKSKDPTKLLMYIIPAIFLMALFWWALQNPSIGFLDTYRNWINRTFEKPEIYGLNGEATQTKLAALRIIPTYFHTPLNHFFGLGPGHTVTRLGGWMLKKYAPLLTPLGVTIHPASDEVFRIVSEGWIAQESTIFFPLFTWAGMWGDIGLVGLASYLYMGYVLWRRVCVDDFGKFMILSTAILGFILTQMEEPGHMLTVACLLALRWHDRQLRSEESF